MAVFDIDSMQAEQNQVKNYIVSALREFPEAARQMSTPAVKMKSALCSAKSVDPAQNNNAAYILLRKNNEIVLSISASGNGFGGFVFGKRKGKKVTPETVADFIIEKGKFDYADGWVRIDNMENARKLFEQALLGKPMRVTGVTSTSSIIADALTKL